MIAPAYSSIANIKSYVGGDKNPPGVKRLVGLSSNENPLGAPQSAIHAIANIIDNIHRYPNGSCDALCYAIGEMHKISSDQIICGNGSDALLHLIMRGYVSQGDEVIFSQHSFQLYEIATYAVGAIPIKASAPELKIDVDALLKSVTSKTKMVIIDNPANPIGSVLWRDEIERLHKGLPPHVLLVLDSAYAEYMHDDNYEDGINLVNKFNNVIMTRTFSKFYGLAGLRLGWCYANPNIITTLQKILPPFSVNILAQTAGLAVLQDNEYAARSYKYNYIVRTKFMKDLEKLGVNYIQSYTNFVMVNLNGEALFNELAKHGIISRRVDNYGLPDWLRISIGLPEQMDQVVNIIREYVTK